MCHFSVEHYDTVLYHYQDLSRLLFWRIRGKFAGAKLKGRVVVVVCDSDDSIVQRALLPLKRHGGDGHVSFPTGKILDSYNTGTLDRLSR